MHVSGAERRRNWLEGGVSDVNLSHHAVLLQGPRSRAGVARGVQRRSGVTSGRESGATPRPTAQRSRHDRSLQRHPAAWMAR